MIKDFKGRIYNIVEFDTSTTLLECVATQQMVRVRNWGWDAIGFVKE